ENVWSPDTQIQAYNPLGKVPCLVMEDGGALFDSRVIVEYLDTLSPVARLIPQSGRERAAVKCWEAIADGVLDACVIIVKENQRPEAQRSDDWSGRQYRKIHAGLDAMDNSLGEQAHCMGGDYRLARRALGCARGHLDRRVPSLGWPPHHPALAGHYERLAARRSFIDSAPPAA